MEVGSPAEQTDPVCSIRALHNLCCLGPIDQRGDVAWLEAPETIMTVAGHFKTVASIVCFRGDSNADAGGIFAFAFPDCCADLGIDIPAEGIGRAPPNVSICEIVHCFEVIFLPDVGCMFTIRPNPGERDIKSIAVMWMVEIQTLAGIPFRERPHGRGRAGTRGR